MTPAGAAIAAVAAVSALAGAILLAHLMAPALDGPPAAIAHDSTAAAGPMRSTETRPLRLTTFGTSLTARGGWQPAIAAALGKRLGREVRTTVVARPGASSEWGRAHVDEVIASDPDVVLIEFAINDAALDRFVTPRRSADNIRAMVAALRRAEPRVAVALATTNPAIGPRGWMRPRLAAYYGQYRALAAELGTGLVDADAGWARLDPEALAAALPDGLHPDPAVATRMFLPAILAAAERW